MGSREVARTEDSVRPAVVCFARRTRPLGRGPFRRTRADHWTWTFKSEHLDRSEDAEQPARRWRTRVCLHQDSMGLRLGMTNGCTGGVPDVTTQPRFVRPLLNQVRFFDAGIHVLPRALFVQSSAAFENFYHHLLSDERKLPLVVLVEVQDESGEPVPGRFGTNPFTLSQWLSGMAHVVCTEGTVGPYLEQVIAPWCQLPPGSARCFEPGFRPDSVETNNPLYVPEGSTHKGLSLAHLTNHLYARSTSPESMVAFQELWNQADAEPARDK